MLITPDYGRIVTPWEFFDSSILQAAVVKVTGGTATNTAVSPATVNFASAAGPNLCLFVPIAYDAVANMRVTACSIAGINLLSAGTIAHNTTSQLYVETYYLVNPPITSSTIKLTVAGTITDIYFNAITFANVNRTTPIRPGTYIADVGNTVTDGTGNYTKVVTSTVGDLTFTAVNGGGGANVNTTQTRDGANSAGTDSFAHDHGTGAASVTHSWSGGGAGSAVAFMGFSIMAQPNLSVIENVNFTKKRSYFF